MLTREEELDLQFVKMCNDPEVTIEALEKLINIGADIHCYNDLPIRIAKANGNKKLIAYFEGLFNNV